MTENTTATADPVTNEAPSQSPTASLKSLIFRGATWTLIGFGTALILRFGSNLILTRLLTPDIYGLAALVWLFTTAIQMFSDLGVGASIVRSNRVDDPAFLDTAWTLQMFRGLLLWVITAVIARPVALFYGQPELQWLLVVAGSIAAIQGFNATTLATCTRQLKVKGLVILELSAQFCGAVSTILIALYWPTAWSMLLGTIVVMLVRLALSHWLLESHPHRLRWDRPAVRELFTFGRWAFVSSLLTFLSSQSDKLVLGKLVNLQGFGLYSIALMLASVPKDLFAKIANELVMPVFVRVLREPDGVVRSTAARMIFLTFSALSCAVVIATAHPIIGLLYPRTYQGAGVFLAVLGLGTWLAIISSSYTALLIGAAHPSPTRYMSLGTTIRAVLFFGLFWPIFQHYGVLGVATLSALCELGIHIGSIYGVMSLGLPTIRVDLIMHLVMLFLTGLFYLVFKLVFAVTGISVVGLASVGLLFLLLGLAVVYVLRNHPALVNHLPALAGVLPVYADDEMAA